MHELKNRELNRETRMAAEAFLLRIGARYALVGAFVFGSRARGDHKAASDVDIAVILAGTPGNRWATASHMAGVAFDVMQETGILIDPLPLWESEYDSPDRFSNPALIHVIKREGLRL